MTRGGLSCVYPLDYATTLAPFARLHRQHSVNWSWVADSYTVPLGAGVRLPFHDRFSQLIHVCRDIGRGRSLQQTATGQGSAGDLFFPREYERAYFDPCEIDYPALPPRTSTAR